ARAGPRQQECGRSPARPHAPYALLAHGAPRPADARRRRRGRGARRRKRRGEARDMNLLRSILFDNLGLKLIALLMAMLVYLNAYTERPASMTLSFPVECEGLPYSLALYGPRPEPVQAELRGTGKQLIRLRLTEPHLRV